MSCNIIGFKEIDKCLMKNIETKEEKKFIKIEFYFEKEHYDEIVYWSKKKKIDIGTLFGEAVYDWIAYVEIEEKRKKLEKQFNSFSKKK